MEPYKDISTCSGKQFESIRLLKSRIGANVVTFRCNVLCGRIKYAWLEWNFKPAGSRLTFLSEHVAAGAQWARPWRDFLKGRCRKHSWQKLQLGAACGAGVGQRAPPPQHQSVGTRWGDWYRSACSFPHSEPEGLEILKPSKVSGDILWWKRSHLISSRLWLLSVRHSLPGKMACSRKCHLREKSE